MTWDTTAFSAGSIPTAADFNARIRDNFKELGDARPTSTPSVPGWTLADGTLSGKYIEAGKLIIGTLMYAVGVGDTKSGVPTFSLPVTSISSTGPPIGTGGLSAGHLRHGSRTPVHLPHQHDDVPVHHRG
jgi:hypothetical protein